MINVKRFFEGASVHASRASSTTPTISVVMPSYRLRENGLTIRSIESVLNQTFSDFEFIIIDDGSNDGLFDVLQQYHQADDRITVIRYDTNSGIPAIRSDEGMMRARGRYIAYQFEDDFWTETALECLLSYVPKQAESVFVYGIANTIGGGEFTKSFPLLGDLPFDYAKLKIANFIANNAVLHSQSLIDTVGMYDPHLLMRRHCDHDLWLRMARLVQPTWCNEIVASVSIAEQHSLGTTVTVDTTMTQLYLTLPRNTQLIPSVIGDFDVTSTEMLPSYDEIDLFQRDYVTTYVAQHANLFGDEERDKLLVSRARPTRLLVAGTTYSTAIDLAVGNFARAIDKPSHQQVFIPEINATLLDFKLFDNILLYGTASEYGAKAMEMAHHFDKPIGYLMDEHVLRLYEMGEQFAHLKPDTYHYIHAEKQIREADAVICCSEIVQSQVRPLNPRALYLKSTIPEHYIRSPFSKPANGRGKRKYAIFGSPTQEKAIAAMWRDIAKFCRKFKDSVEFYFWGFDASKLEPLAVPTTVRQFPQTYEEYMSTLRQKTTS